jgi:hypothetical protein
MGSSSALVPVPAADAFIFYNNVFFWIIVCGLFFGAALGRMTRFLPANERRDKARNRKWIFVTVYFSLAVAAFLFGLLLPGPEKIQDIRLLYFFGGSAFVAFFAVRFKKSVGLPILVLSSLLVIMVMLFFQAITAFTGETEIARLKVLSLKDEGMKVELSLPGNPKSELVDLQGEYFAPVAKIVVFDDYLVFFGARTYYRFLGLSSFKAAKTGEIPVQATIYNLARPSGLSETVYSFFEQNEKSIPGVKTVQMDMNVKRARELETYRVMVQNDGGVEVVVDR